MTRLANPFKANFDRVTTVIDDSSLKAGLMTAKRCAKLSPANQRLSLCRLCDDTAFKPAEVLPQINEQE